MHIDIVSDVICPWCFIGKRRLARALEQRPDLTASTTWRAFQLNPDMPEGGMPREAYLNAKFGSAGHAARIYATIAEAGAGENIAFAFERIRRTPNSRDAHRLIRFASMHGNADPIVEALFSAYFEHGRDIGDPATLADLAAETGYERAEVSAWLGGDAAAAEVLAEDRSARRLGISGVPCFIVDGGYAISGAQEPEFFFPLFDLAQNAAVRASA
ncbi:MAG: DsbA family oxidoreductase [Alphaproteobacteria bacterium]|nr:DsbA family oxidoreductase [Alphaproteobacteria bacterium]